MVMANLRKRVAAVDLSRKKPPPLVVAAAGGGAADDPNANNDTGQPEPLDNRPLLPKASFYI